MVSFGNPFIKHETDEDLITKQLARRCGSTQITVMAQHGFNHFGVGHGGGSINPNDLNFNQGFQNFNNNNNSNSNPNNNNTSNAFASGAAVFDDDELLDGLGSPTDQSSGMQGQEYGSIMGYNQSVYGNNHNNTSSSHHSMPLDQSHMPGYSNTPDGDPIQSPFVQNFAQYRQMPPHSFATSLQSPISYASSPLANDMNNDGGDHSYLNAKARQRLQAGTMQRKASATRSPLPPQTNGIGISVGPQDGFGAQPIRNGGHHHEPSASGQWAQTPNSLASFPGSGMSSPLQTGLHSLQQLDGMVRGGASMPAKLGQPSAVTSTQEAKRKRRRESHNLVERRRRDNINERIQDLSKLVPSHRLEDDKIRKLITNGTPLSPTLTGIPNPPSATSGLAGPGARRATSSNAGNITTGLPIEDKDKGPNKGDILNGSVSWTRDLMWMLHLKIQQQEELMNTITELGGHFPFELTEDEKRMQTELLEAMARNETAEFTYSRTPGSGLRVPHHTDYKGEPLNDSGHSTDLNSISSNTDANGLVGNEETNHFWPDDDDGPGDIKFDRDSFAEEDEFGMDIS